MIRSHDDFELQQELEAAQRETAASEATTERARTRRSSSARKVRRNRRVRILAVCTGLVSLFGWTSLQDESPSEVDLRHGPQVVLQLAAEWAHDYMRRNGRPPTRLAEELPVAAAVQLTPQTGGVRLSIRDSDGVEHATFVPKP